ncbi:MAG: ABC transporter ATP-binding protein [Cytophagales bacterium CG12_big_fil_rev_8_21_14_0_65_40_12]|nr:MAG: ABC transporter ATP-binding protein [Cytophagales bacterium CG12_big_fil_rev_8_21_14_0_65_40_12]PIW02793.1 MAG: ABC transporter ATP-binding protein [Cytophagales bacterium CG17_big_fil_post_rev_8_21_14_2_50_40_13]
MRRYFKTFTFFYSYLGNRIFLVLFFSLLVGVLDGFGLTMFIPLLEMIDTNSVSSEDNLGLIKYISNFFKYLNIPFNLSTIMIFIVVFFALKGLFKYLEGYCRVIFQQFFMRRIRIDNAEALSLLGYQNFCKIDSGRIQNTFSSEISRVNMAFFNFFLAAQSIIFLLVYIGLALVTNAQFALLVAVGGLVTNVFFRFLYRRTKLASRIYTQEAESFEGLLIQKVNNFKYLKATGYIREYTNKVKDRIFALEKVQRRLGLLDIGMQATREPLIILVVVIVMVVQVKYFSEPIASIILSLLFFYRALTYVMALQKQWNSFLSVSGSLENMISFIEELKQGEEIYGTRKFVRFRDKLSLNSVRFSYDERQVIRNVDLNIYKNETIAFVGESGSGKTTLMNILVGLLRPTGGVISIEDIDYEKLDISTFQHRIGYITQEPVIFSDTVFNNVTFWDERTDKNFERFEDVLRKAAIYDFIQDQPLKENALLGTNGINLSGGQKQRLSIARELYKEVDFLMMDEATSALDSETERVIQNHIESLKGLYTIIIIAHRLSTVRNADRIVLVRNGEIDEIGDFETLMMKSKVFKRMVELQEF